MRRILKGAAVMAACLMVLTGCGWDDNKDSASRDDSYSKLQESQPGKTMTFSPTRETINFWVEKWSKPGKLSYVYLQNSNGDLLGYYVLEGLPVSYCAQISPNYEVKSRGSGVVVPAPANDGTYYSQGGNCNTYYGKDATTGAYIEYTAGLGINVLLFDEPMPNTNGVKPLGKTTIKDAEEKK